MRAVQKGRHANWVANRGQARALPISLNWLDIQPSCAQALSLFGSKPRRGGGLSATHILTRQLTHLCANNLLDRFPFNPRESERERERREALVNYLTGAPRDAFQCEADKSRFFQPERFSCGNLSHYNVIALANKRFGQSRNPSLHSFKRSFKRPKNRGVCISLAQIKTTFYNIHHQIFRLSGHKYSIPYQTPDFVWYMLRVLITYFLFLFLSDFVNKVNKLRIGQF